MKNINTYYTILYIDPFYRGPYLPNLIFGKVVTVQSSNLPPIKLTREVRSPGYISENII